jgi:hypothetical protein
MINKISALEHLAPHDPHVTALTGKLTWISILSGWSGSTKARTIPL